MVDVVRNVTVRGRSEGLDTLASALNKVRDAQNALAQSSGSGTGVEATTRGVLSAQAAWERYENRIDAAARAARNAERDLSTVNRVFDQGRISSERYSEELTRIQANLDKVSAANTRLNATQKLVDEGLAASARLQAARRAESDAYQARISQQKLNTTADANQAAFSSFMGVGSGTGNSARASAAAFEEAFREQDAMAKAANELRAKIDPVGHAFMILGEEIAQYNKMAASGVISTQELAKAVQGAQDKFAGVSRNYGGDRGANASKFMATAGTNLGYQVNDIISGLAMGQSPMTILTQQGGQVYQALAQGGGSAVGGVKALGEAVAHWVTPAIGVMGGLTLGVGAAALAYRNLAASQREVALALSGAGRASGATQGGIEALAMGQSGMSAANFRTGAAEFAQTGRIGMQMYADLNKAAKEYATLTGGDLATSQKALASAFADPAKGADELNKVLGGLDDRTTQLIIHMQASGDRAGAQRIMFDAFATTLARGNEHLTVMQRALEATGSAWSDFWGRVGKGVANVTQGGSTLEEQLETAQKLLASAQARQSGTYGSLLPGLSASETAANQKAVADLMAKIDDKKVSAFAAAAAQSSKEIGEITRAASPAQAEVKKLEDEYKRLQEAVKDPIKAGIFGNELKDASDVLDTVHRKWMVLQDDVAKYGSAAQAASVRAAEFANRTVGYAGIGRTTADINQAAAEKARNADSRELAAIERERQLNLETARRQDVISATSASGLANRAGNLLPQIQSAAAARGLDVNTFLALINTESSFNPNAAAKTSSAYGLTQLTAGTARMLGVDRMDVGQNLEGGANYWAQAMAKAGNDPARAYYLYHDGLGSDPSNPSAEALKGAGRLTAALGSPSSLQQAAQTKALTDAIDDQSRLLDVNTATWDKTQAARDKATYAQEKVNDLIKQGIPPTQAQIQVIGELADKYATLQQKAAAVNLTRTMMFERSDLGLNATDAAATQRVRGAGIDTDSAQGQALIQQAKLNDELKQSKDLATNVFQGMGQDMLNGAKGADVLHNALTKIESKLMNMAIDNLVSNAFKGLLGSGSGSGILGLFGFGTGSSGSGTVALDQTMWHADGGMIRGPGTSRSDSILARLSDGEFIVNAKAASQHLDILHAINASGLPGFANGGLAGGPSFADIMALRGGAAAGGHGEIIVNNFSGQPVETKRVDGPKGPRTEISIGQAINQHLLSPDAAPVLRKLGLSRMGMGNG